MSINAEMFACEEDKVQEFFKSLKGEIIVEFKALQWYTDPKFLIRTDKTSFILHSNDLGVYVSDIEV